MWTAYYKDGTDLSERGADGSIRLFKDIVQDNLKIFYLHEGAHDISVNFETGVFEVDGRELGFSDNFEELRLIYFKRVQKEFKLDSTLLFEKRIHYVGWQSTVNGKNVKRYLGFDGDKLLIHCE